MTPPLFASETIQLTEDFVETIARKQETAHLAPLIAFDTYHVQTKQNSTFWQDIPGRS